MIDKQERDFKDDKNFSLFDLETLTMHDPTKNKVNEITDDMFSGEIVEDE